VDAQATGQSATALGRESVAAFDGSTALGAGATTTRAGQIMLGDTGSSVTIGDIAASTAAQSGPVKLMTVDGSGTVGQSAISLTDLQAAAGAGQQLSDLDNRVDTLETTSATHTQQIAAVQQVNTTQSQQIAAVQNVNNSQQQTIDQHTQQIAANQQLDVAQEARITSLQTISTSQGATISQHTAQIGSLQTLAQTHTGQLNTLQSAVSGLSQRVTLIEDALFELQGTTLDASRANEGVAMALAMETPALPAGASFAMSGGVGYYNGRASLATAISAAVGRTSSVSAGVGYAVKSGEFGARAGFQIAW
jgi:hypothetical protein